MTETTFIKSEYRPCSGRRTVEGVLFKSYSTGISRYCQITENGKIKTNYSGSGYTAAVIGHGYVLSGNSTRAKVFRTHEAAARAALKIWLKISSERP